MFRITNFACYHFPVPTFSDNSLTPLSFWFPSILDYRFLVHDLYLTFGPNSRGIAVGLYYVRVCVHGFPLRCPRVREAQTRMIIVPLRVIVVCVVSSVTKTNTGVSYLLEAGDGENKNLI